jgi:hypothetical protein
MGSENACSEGNVNRTDRRGASRVCRTSSPIWTHESNQKACKYHPDIQLNDVIQCDGNYGPNSVMSFMIFVTELTYYLTPGRSPAGLVTYETATETRFCDAIQASLTVVLTTASSSLA